MSVKPDSMARLFAKIDSGDVSVPELPNAIRQAGGPYMAIVAAVREMAAASGGTEWGDITGTITDQTDLVSYVDSRVVGLFDYKGVIDASGNPNYPAALKGDVYRVSVAGKVGGASGKVVGVGDFVVALADNAGGTEASVGTSWGAWEANIDGAVIGPASATDNAFALFDQTTGKLIKNSTSGYDGTALKIRNGATEQTAEVYDFYTDASNYLRLETLWSGGVMYLRVIGAGTGAGTGTIRFSCPGVMSIDGGAYVNFAVAGVDKLIVASDATLPAVNNDHDLGRVANRFKDTYLSGIIELLQVASGGTPSANSARLYSKDVAGTAQAFACSETGAETQLTGVVPAADGTYALPTSITIVNGIITAIS